MMSTENDNTRELVYLAGLLHTVGKFCPDFSALWQQTPYFHEPTAEETVIINRAIRWATRLDQQQANTELIEQPLQNLFGQIRINNKPGGHQTFGFHPVSLRNEVVLQQAVGSLDGLRSQFIADFNKLPTTSIRVFSDSLYHLLRQYTWCIPASTMAELSGISLFHHLKLTGALTQCLFDYETAEKKDVLPMQLVCVDLSGIQSFIYNIGSKYAARSLKGRSFSLQLLLDGIARKLIEDTNTTPAHLVYSSGGKFFMLLPNTVSINETLTRTETEIQKAVWETYQGNLFVCFGAVSFDYDPDSGQVTTASGTHALSKLWAEVTSKAAEQKAQKNKTLILDKSKFIDLFGPTGDGGETEQCLVTGWEGKLVETKDKKSKVHSTVKDQIDIGSALADADFITLGEGEFQLLSTTDSPSETVIRPFGFVKPTDLSRQTEYSQLIQPGTENSFLHGRLLGPVVRSFRFYGGSEQARSEQDKRQPKNFEELAGIVRQNPEVDDSPIKQRDGKYNRLAVLRMDVDSLGELFTKGFQENNATFSAYATLSGLLDWFFSGYLNTIRAQYANWVNIIYSGGDDVFAVGRWDEIIAFADHIQRDFEAFTGRPDLTISAGIVLMRPRYPIGKAADQAGEAEDLAKDHEYLGHKKNAVCLFNLAVNWELEWPFVKEYHTKFVTWLREGTISSGILQKLFAYYDIYAKGEADRKAAKKRGQNDYQPDLSWKWNAAYTLSRHRTDENEIAINDLQQLIFTRINDGNVRFEALAMAMRWAELTVRDDRKPKSNDNGTGDKSNA